MNYEIAPTAPLTPREKEVMAWKALGKTNEVVAIIIGTTPRTVKAHAANICTKLSAENITHAVSICWANRWVITKNMLFLSLLAHSFALDTELRATPRPTPQKNPQSTRVVRVARRHKNGLDLTVDNIL